MNTFINTPKTKKRHRIMNATIFGDIEIGKPLRYEVNGKVWQTSNVEHLIAYPDGSTDVITVNSIYEFPTNTRREYLGG